MNRNAEIAERVAKSVVADADFYKKRFEEALSTFAYVPIEYAWDDPKRQREVHRWRKEIEKQIAELVESLPIPTKFQVVFGMRESKEFDDEDELIREMKKLGIRHTGYSKSGGHLRPELWDKPMFDKLVGPMYGGVKKVRYETQEAYDIFST